MTCSLRSFDINGEQLAQNEECRTILAATSLRLQARFDILDVLMGWRPAARLLLSRGGLAEEAVRLSISYGLHVKVDPSLVRQSIPQSHSPYVDQLRFDSFSSNEELLVVLFIGRGPGEAETAFAADRAADDERLGRALGYPLCCVRSVVSRGFVPTLAESLSLYGTGGFDPLLWPALSVNDAGLIPHFPCNAACEPSKGLAMNRYTVLSRCGYRGDMLRVRRTAMSCFSVDEHGHVQMRLCSEIEMGNLGWVRPRSELPSFHE